MLGLGTGIVKGGAGAKTIVTDNLVLKHNYNAGRVHQVSTGAAFFDASNTDSISLGVGTALTPMATGFTACFWAKSNDISASGMVLAGDNGTNQRMYIGHHSSGNWDFGIGNSSWTGASNTLTTEWTHIALTYTTGDVAQLYINGVKDREDTNNDADGFTDGTFGGDFYIGQHGSSTGYAWDGYVCNVGIWTRALTQAEVKSIMWKNYDQLISSEKTSMVSWWNLDSVIDSTDTAGHGDTSVYDNHHGGGDTLGSNLITGNDSTFSGTSSNWTAINTSSLSYDGSKLISTIGGGSNGDDEGAQLEVTSLITAGKTYKITADIWLGTYVESPTGQFRVFLGGVQAQLTPTTTQTTYTFYLTTSNTTDLKIYQNDADNTEGTFFIDNVSVQLVNGNTGTLS